MRAKQRGTGLRDVTENCLLLRRKPFHGFHQVRDQVRPPLQDDIHLGPRGVHRFALHHHLVSATDKRTSQQQRNYQQNNQNDQSILHIRLESIEFTNAHSSRAAIPAWENDGPEHPRLFPMPLDTRSEEHTSELQSLRTISYAVFCLKKKKKKK